MTIANGRGRPMNGSDNASDNSANARKRRNTGGHGEKQDEAHTPHFSKEQLDLAQKRKGGASLAEIVAEKG